jgi:hypothetical protein
VKHEQPGILKMKKRFKGIQIFLVIAISLFILAFPAYLRSPQLSQTKFVSSDLSFENTDQEEGLPDNEKELRIYVPNASVIIFLSRTNFFGLSFHSFPQVLSPHQRIVVLRC